MVKLARLLVLVQDHDHKIIKDAKVEGKLETEKEFEDVPFTKRYQRYIRDELKPDSFEVRVSGQGNYFQETRTIDLQSGDNHIHVMLGKPGMLKFKLAGMNYYFEPHEEELILMVKGAKDVSEVSKVLKKEDLKYEIVYDDDKKIKHDNLLIKIKIGKNEEAELAREKLQKIMKKEFSKLTAILAAPIYKNNKFSEGITNELIIRFKPNVSFDKIKEFAKEKDLDLKYRILFINNGVLFSLKRTPSYGILETIAEIEESEHVIYAQPNLIRRLKAQQYTPNDFLFPELSHLKHIRCDYAWDILNPKGGSPDITIAVVDPYGVDPTHPDLTGQLSDGSEKMITSWDFVNNTAQRSANLLGSHGTKSAGSATARMDNTIGIVGVAPNCHLIGCRWDGDLTDNIGLAHIWAWMAAFPYRPNPNSPSRLEKGADIISNSWAPPRESPLETDAVIRDVIDFLTTFGREGRGCLICYSLGNYGYMLVDNFNPYSFDEKTLGIGASINRNPTNPCLSFWSRYDGWGEQRSPVEDTRCYYSMYGTTVDLVSPSNTCYYFVNGPPPHKTDPIPACVAQNQGDCPADSDYGIGSISGFGGTSHSCPTVAGAAALLLSVQPDLTWVELRDILRNTADKIDQAPIAFPAGATLTVEQKDLIRIQKEWELDTAGNPIFSQWYGYGRLNVEEAVNRVLSDYSDLNQRADVVIRDNLADTGAVPSQGWHANSPDIWVRQTNDPIPDVATLPYDRDPPHQNPIDGQTNYVYLRVKNIGGASASVVYVRAYIANYPGLDFQYPEDWIPDSEFGEIPDLSVGATCLIGEAKIEDLVPDEVTTVKIKWDVDLIPPQEITINNCTIKWHPCILAEVSPHDGPSPVPDVHPVMGNNNLAHKNISIEYTDGPSTFGTVIVAGTHQEAGVQSIIIDRATLPKKYKVFVTTHDKYSKYWKRIGEMVKVKFLPAKKSLLIDSSSRRVALPLKLRKNRYIPIIVGIKRPKLNPAIIEGSVRITQKRRDDINSPGYEIFC